MIPTREQFKEFMAYVQNAQKKEDKVNDAFELIWDEEQAQHVPFYISPWWKVVRYAFYIMEYRKEYDPESLIGTKYEYLLHENEYDEE